MLSPTTLTFCVLVLVLGERPLRTGVWFYLGALTATLGIGVVAAFVLGDAAASSDPSSPKTWVAIFDIVAAVVLLALVVRVLRRAREPGRVHPDRAQGHLGDRPERHRVHRAVGVLLARVAAPARDRARATP